MESAEDDDKMSSEEFHALLEVKELELKRLTLEHKEKDSLLASMEKTIAQSSNHVEQLMKETRELSAKTEETYRTQLKEKAKQLELMQALLDDAQKNSRANTDMLGSSNDPTKLDRAFMDDFLISVLEQKDQLADQLYTLNNNYADIKAKLGMAEFEKEKLLAQSRATARSAEGAVSESFNVVEFRAISRGASPLITDRSANASPVEQLSSVLAERDQLAESLADANHTVEQLRERLAKATQPAPTAKTSARDSERAKRKEAHRKGKPMSKSSKVEELELENKSLAAQLEEQSIKVQQLEEEFGGPAGMSKMKDLELEVDSLTGQLDRQNAEYESIKEEVNMLTSLMGSGNSNMQTMELEAKLSDAENKISNADERAEAFREELASALDQLADARQTLKSDEDISSKIEVLKQQLVDERKEANTVIESQEVVIKQLTDFKALYEELNKQIETMREEQSQAAKGHENSKVEMEKAIVDRNRVHELFLAEQAQRRRLHNRLVELQGNIRVFARIRPLLPHDNESECNEVVRMVDSLTVEAEVQGSWRQFEYDHAFSPTITPVDVFDKVNPLVDSFLDGYNVCILAYGQTGSGKTHTMLGPLSTEGNVDMTGIIPLAMSTMFAHANESKESAICEFSVSVLEVYNEYVRDLASSTPWEKHEVTEAAGFVDVPTAVKTEVASAEDVINIVAAGMSARVERKTDLNEHSSRSHLVITAYMTKTSLLKDGSVVASRMHLVDLAGSENAKMAGSGTHDAQGLQEGKAINRSLSALSSVFMNLSKQAGNLKQHVPYRNSKLTYLLKDAIGGNAKTLMIICLPPTRNLLAESVQSLRFGSQVRCIEKGAATKNVVTGKKSTGMTNSKISTKVS